MDEKRKRFSKTIKDIEFKMILEGDTSWIKVIPLIQVSNPSSLHLILNDEHYNWDIYDKDGREAHEIYFEGSNVIPSFYLKSKDGCHRVNFDKNGIKVIPITENHTLDKYLKKYCSCNYPQANCWAKAVYYTSRPDKSPFNEM